VTVLVGAAGIRFALVPNGAFDAVSNCWVENAIVDIRGALVAGERIAGSPWALAVFAVGGPGFNFGLVGGCLFFEVVFALGLFPIFDELSVASVGFENIASYLGFCG
jgi:hypothetical protein